MSSSMSTSDKPCAKKWEEKLHKVHNDRRHRVKAQIDMKAPVHFCTSTRRSNAKRELQNEEWKKQVDKQNRSLQKRVQAIGKRPGTRAKVAQTDVHRPRHLARSQEKLAIDEQNARMTERIRHVMPVYRRVDWRRHELQQLQYYINACRYPNVLQCNNSVDKLKRQCEQEKREWDRKRAAAVQAEVTFLHNCVRDKYRRKLQPDHHGSARSQPSSPVREGTRQVPYFERLSFTSSNTPISGLSPRHDPEPAISSPRLIAIEATSQSMTSTINSTNNSRSPGPKVFLNKSSLTTSELFSSRSASYSGAGGYGHQRFPRDQTTKDSTPTLLGEVKNADVSGQTSAGNRLLHLSSSSTVGKMNMEQANPSQKRPRIAKNMGLPRSSTSPKRISASRIALGSNPSVKASKFAGSALVKKKPGVSIRRGDRKPAGPLLHSSVETPIVIDKNIPKASRHSAQSEASISSKMGGSGTRLKRCLPPASCDFRTKARLPRRRDYASTTLPTSKVSLTKEQRPTQGSLGARRQAAAQKDTVNPSRDFKKASRHLPKQSMQRKHGTTPSSEASSESPHEIGVPSTHEERENGDATNEISDIIRIVEHKIDNGNPESLAQADEHQEADIAVLHRAICNETLNTDLEAGEGSRSLDAQLTLHNPLEASLLKTQESPSVDHERPSERLTIRDIAVVPPCQGTHLSSPAPYLHHFDDAASVPAASQYESAEDCQQKDPHEPFLAADLRKDSPIDDSSTTLIEAVNGNPAALENSVDKSVASMASGASIHLAGDQGFKTLIELDEVSPGKKSTILISSDVRQPEKLHGDAQTKNELDVSSVERGNAFNDIVSNSSTGIDALKVASLMPTGNLREQQPSKAKKSPAHSLRAETEDSIANAIQEVGSPNELFAPSIVKPSSPNCIVAKSEVPPKKLDSDNVDERNVGSTALNLATADSLGKNPADQDWETCPTNKNLMSPTVIHTARMPNRAPVPTIKFDSTDPSRNSSSNSSKVRAPNVLNDEILGEKDGSEQILYNHAKSILLKRTTGGSLTNLTDGLNLYNLREEEVNKPVRILQSLMEFEGGTKNILTRADFGLCNNSSNQMEPNRTTGLPSSSKASPIVAPVGLGALDASMNSSTVSQLNSSVSSTESQTAPLHRGVPNETYPERAVNSETPDYINSEYLGGNPIPQHGTEACDFRDQSRYNETLVQLQCAQNGDLSHIKTDDASLIVTRSGSELGTLQGRNISLEGLRSQDLCSAGTSDLSETRESVNYETPTPNRLSTAKISDVATGTGLDLVRTLGFGDQSQARPPHVELRATRKREIQHDGEADGRLEAASSEAAVAEDDDNLPSSNTEPPMKVSKFFGDTNDMKELSVIPERALNKSGNTTDAIAVSQSPCDAEESLENSASGDINPTFQASGGGNEDSMLETQSDVEDGVTDESDDSDDGDLSENSDITSPLILKEDGALSPSNTAPLNIVSQSSGDTNKMKKEELSLSSERALNELVNTADPIVVSQAPYDAEESLDNAASADVDPTYRASGGGYEENMLIAQSDPENRITDESYDSDDGHLSGKSDVTSPLTLLKEDGALPPSNAAPLNIVSQSSGDSNNMHKEKLLLSSERALDESENTADTIAVSQAPCDAGESLENAASGNLNPTYQASGSGDGANMLEAQIDSEDGVTDESDNLGNGNLSENGDATSPTTLLKEDGIVPPSNTAPLNVVSQSSENTNNINKDELPLSSQRALNESDNTGDAIVASQAPCDAEENLESAASAEVNHMYQTSDGVDEENMLEAQSDLEDGVTEDSDDLEDGNLSKKSDATFPLTLLKDDGTLPPSDTAPLNIVSQSSEDTNNMTKDELPLSSQRALNESDNTGDAIVASQAPCDAEHSSANAASAEVNHMYQASDGVDEENMLEARGDLEDGVTDDNGDSDDGDLCEKSDVTSPLTLLKEDETLTPSNTAALNIAEVSQSFDDTNNMNKEELPLSSYKAPNESDNTGDAIIGSQAPCDAEESLENAASVEVNHIHQASDGGGGVNMPDSEDDPREEATDDKDDPAGRELSEGLNFTSSVTSLAEDEENPPPSSTACSDKDSSSCRDRGGADNFDARLLNNGSLVSEAENAGDIVVATQPPCSGAAQPTLDQTEKLVSVAGSEVFTTGAADQPGVSILAAARNASQDDVRIHVTSELQQAGETGSGTTSQAEGPPINCESEAGDALQSEAEFPGSLDSAAVYGNSTVSRGKSGGEDTGERSELKELRLFGGISTTSHQCEARDEVLKTALLTTGDSMPRREQDVTPSRSPVKLQLNHYTGIDPFWGMERVEAINQGLNQNGDGRPSQLGTATVDNAKSSRNLYDSNRQCPPSPRRPEEYAEDFTWERQRRTDRMAVKERGLAYRVFFEHSPIERSPNSRDPPPNESVVYKKPEEYLQDFTWERKRRESKFVHPPTE